MVATEIRQTAHACPTCGSEADLVPRSYHIGGHGYETFLECRDWRACQRRANERLDARTRAYLNSLLDEA